MFKYWASMHAFFFFLFVLFLTTIIQRYQYASCTHTVTHTRAHTHTHLYTIFMNRVYQPNKRLVTSSLLPLPPTHQNFLLSNHGHYILISETIFKMQFHRSFLFQPEDIWITRLLVCRHQICSPFSFHLCHV